MLSSLLLDDSEAVVIDLISVGSLPLRWFDRKATKSNSILTCTNLLLVNYDLNVLE